MLYNTQVPSMRKSSENSYSTNATNPSGAETGIFQVNSGNIVAADVLAPYITRWSAAMILKMCNVAIRLFPESGFTQPVAFETKVEE